MAKRSEIPTTCLLSSDDAQTVLAAIRAHQSDQTKHPLTCGNDSSHSLQGQGRPHPGGRTQVLLVCNDCTYRQTYIPPFLIPGSIRNG